MGNGVTIQFDAQTADYVQKVLAAKKATEEAGEAAEKSGEKMARFGEKMGKTSDTAGGDLIKNLTAGAVAFAGITAAIDIARNALVAFHAEQEKKAQDARTTIGGALGAMAQINRPQDYNAFAAIPGAIDTKLYSQKALGEIAAEIAKRNPNAPVDQWRMATQAAADAGKAGFANPTLFGDTLLKLKKIGEAPGGGWENFGDKEYKNLTADFLAHNPEGLDDKAIQILNRAKNKNLAYDQYAAFAQVGEIKSVESFMKMAGFEPSKAEQHEWRTKKNHLSDEERSKRDIYHAGKNADERLQAMIEHPELLPSTERGIGESVKRAYIAGRAFNLRTGQGFNDAGRIIDNARNTDEGVGAYFKDREAQAAQENLDAQGGPKALATVSAAQELGTQAQGATGSKAVGEWAKYGASFVDKKDINKLTDISKIVGLLPKDVQRFANPLGVIGDQLSHIPSPFSAEFWKHHDPNTAHGFGTKMLDALEEQTEHLATIAKQTRGRTEMGGPNEDK